jgi:hypothetical protein
VPIREVEPRLGEGPPDILDERFPCQQGMQVSSSIYRRWNDSKRIPRFSGGPPGRPNPLSRR